MKITKSELQQLVNEQINHALNLRPNVRKFEAGEHAIELMEKIKAAIRKEYLDGYKVEELEEMLVDFVNNYMQS